MDANPEPIIQESEDIGVIEEPEAIKMAEEKPVPVPKPKRKRKAKKKAKRKSKRKGNIKEIYQSEWVDGEGNLYYLDETGRGAYTLRLKKRARS